MSAFWKVATLFVHVNVSLIWIVTSSTAPPTCTQHTHSSLRPCPPCLPRPTPSFWGHWKEPLLCLVSTPGGSGGWAEGCRPTEQLHCAEHHFQCSGLMRGHMTVMWQMKRNNWNWKMKLGCSGCLDCLGCVMHQEVLHGGLAQCRRTDKGALCGIYWH